MIQEQSECKDGYVINCRSWKTGLPLFGKTLFTLKAPGIFCMNSEAQGNFFFNTGRAGSSI
jgi:hypothetical protein